MKAFIEQIELGHNERKILGIRFKETDDRLDISNKPSMWILDLFSGYKQLARFPIKRPHNFKENEWIDVDIVNNEVVNVKKLLNCNFNEDMVEARVNHSSRRICSKCYRTITKCSKLNCSKVLNYGDIIHCMFRKHYCYNCGK